MRSLLFVVLVACGGGGGSAPPPASPTANVAQPAADPAPCADAAANAVKLLAKDEAQYADKINAMMVQHCQADAWSLELRKCLLLAKAPPDLDPCEQFFAGDQRDQYAADLRTLTQSTAPDAPPPSNTTPPVPPPAGQIPPK